MSKPLNESIRDDLVKIFKEDEQVVTEAAKPIAKIHSKDYLKWFYSNTKDREILARKVINNLTLHGKVTMNLDDVFRNTQFLPTQLITNFDEIKSQLSAEQQKTAVEKKLVDDPSQVFDTNWIR